VPTRSAPFKGVKDQPASRFGSGWWPVALLALAYVGYFKGNPRLATAPVDLTLAATTVVVAGVAIQIMKKSQYAALPMARVSMLFAAFMPGAVLSEDFDKTLMLFTITALCALAPAYFLVTERAQQWFIGATVAGAVVMGINVFLFPDVEAREIYGRLSADGSDTIATSRVIAAGVVVTVSLCFFASKWRLPCIALSVAGAGLIAAVGSRGALAGAIAAIAFVLVFARAFSGMRVKAVGVGIAVVWFAAWIVSLSPTGGGARLAAFLTGQESDEGRSLLAHEALKLIPAHPFGMGWGGFGSLGLFYRDRPLAYPHNLLLETALEGGWIASAALIVVAGMSIRSLVLSSESPTGVALLGLGIYWMTVAQTSSDINGNRMTWVMVSVGLVLGSQRVATHRRQNANQSFPQ
jgi:hypothetical protein